MKKTAHTQQIAEPGPGAAIAELNDPGQFAHQARSSEKAGRPELPDSLDRFMRQRRIDSYHKIWFLLFMHQHAEQRLISREYIRQVTFADAPTLDEVIGELRQAGLLTVAGEMLRLDEASEVRRELDAMALVFEDPTGRQELLRLLYGHAAAPVYWQRIDSTGGTK